MAEEEGAGGFLKCIEVFRGIFRFIGRYFNITLINKYWGYNCLTFMYFVCLVLVCVSFGMPLFRDHYDGTHYFPASNCTLANPVNTTWSVTEFYFELVVNLGGSDITCKYSDGQCNLGPDIGPCLPNLNQKWDLSYYASNYGASFAFSVIAVILCVVILPFLQFLQWKPNWVQRPLRITLFWITFGLAIAIFVSLLVSYSVQFGHPRVVTQATGNGVNYCNKYNVNNHFYAGVLCSWLGHRSVGYWAYPTYLPFTGITVTNFYEYWEPRVGWQLLQTSLGISLWNIIVVVGWRPNFAV